MAVISRVRRYVVELGGNQAKPTDEQIAAYLRPITVFQKQDQLRKFIGMEPEALLKQMTKREETNVILQILKDNVVRFENLDIEDDNGNKTVATIEELWNLGEFELCMEIFNALMRGSQLKEEEAKNSESPSGTSVTPITH